MSDEREREDRDTRVLHCAQAENDDPRDDRVPQVASRASRAMRFGGRDDSGRRLVHVGWNAGDAPRFGADDPDTP